MNGGKNAASREAEKARQAEEERQARIRSGTRSINQTFGQFDNKFFSGVQDSYSDYALPELDKQANDAREQLTYSLARNGTLDSSARSHEFGRLADLYNTAKLNIADQARSYATDARSNVEKNRADLIAMLQGTGDAQGATQAALARAETLAQPPAYSPLGQIFTDFTSGLGTQAALEKSYALGSGIEPTYKTGLFGVPKNSVKVS